MLGSSVLVVGNNVHLFYLLVLNLQNFYIVVEVINPLKALYKLTFHNIECLPITSTTLNFALRRIELVDFARLKSNTCHYNLSESLLKTPPVPQK